MMLSQEHSTLLWVTVAVAAAKTKGKEKTNFRGAMLYRTSIYID